MAEAGAMAGWLGVLLAMAAILLVALARLPWAPSVRACLRGDGDEIARLRCALGLAAISGAATALLACRRRTARHGSFARVAAIVLAAGIPLGGHALSGPQLGCEGIAIAALLAVLCAVLLLPLLRERGLLSLVLVTTLVALPSLLAWRLCLRDGRSARWTAMLQDIARPGTFAGGAMALLLDQEVEDDLQRAMALLLRPPFRTEPIDILAARRDQPAARWLLRMGLPSLRFSAAGFAFEPPVREQEQLCQGLLPVSGGFQGATWYARAPAAPAGAVAVCFTPFGDSTVPLVDGLARPPQRDRERLAVWLATWPGSLRIRVLVVPPDPAGAYGWVDLSS